MYRILVIFSLVIMLTGVSSAAPDCSEAQIAITNSDWFSEDRVIDIEVANAGDEVLEGFEFSTSDGDIDYNQSSTARIEPGQTKSFLMGKVWETPVEDLRVESTQCSGVSTSDNIVFRQNSEFESKDVDNYHLMNVEMDEQQKELEIEMEDKVFTESEVIDIGAKEEVELLVNNESMGIGNEFEIERGPGTYNIEIRKNNELEGLTEIDYVSDSAQIEVEEASIFTKAINWITQLV